MSDTKLTYWEGWIIAGHPERKSPPYTPLILLCDLRKKPIRYNAHKLSEDVEYLLETINAHPEPLDDDLLKSHIIKWSRLASKNKEAKAIHEKIFKSLKGDGRKHKAPSVSPGDLHEDVEFFWFMLNSRTFEEPDEKAIERYLGPRQQHQMSNYQATYYAYLKVYRQLKETLTQIEIFDFLKCAADHVHEVDCICWPTPDGRGLMYAKTKGDTIHNP
jgi:hypothetical protein